MQNYNTKSTRGLTLTTLFEVGVAFQMWSFVNRLHRSVPSRSWVRLHSGSAMPSTLSTVEVAAKAPLITAYSSGGFTLQNAYVVGSVGLLPRGYFHWNIKRAEDITIESLALFHMVVPRIGV